MAEVSARDLLEWNGKLPGRLSVVEEEDHGATPTFMVRADYGWAERILCGGCYQQDAEMLVAALEEVIARAPDDGATDPRQLGGAISGPGGAFDADSVVIDTRNAVILEGCEVAIVGGVRGGVLDPKPITALVLRGRINKTPERVQALYLLNEDGAAGIVTQLVDVAARAGWGREFVDRVVARLEAMPEGPRS